MQKYFAQLAAALLCLTTFSITEAGGATPIHTFEPRWYVGGGVTYNASIHFRISSFPNGDIIHNTKQIGFESFIGAQANEYFGGELGYANLNKTVFSQVRLSSLLPVHNVTKLWNLHLIGIARYPIIGHTLYLFVLAGMAWFNSKTQRSPDISSGLPVEQTITSSTINLMYGAGAEADFSRWAIRLTYNHFNADFLFNNQPPSASIVIPYINYLTLSLLVRF